MTERNHQLRAILEADVAGYSRLIGNDVEGTARTLKSHQDEVWKPKISEFGGRLNDFTGDACLAEFNSVRGAVHCAIDVQRLMAEHNSHLSAERRMEFRIGIYFGEVIHQIEASGLRVYGDPVNIAARLEALAEPGGICVSSHVHDLVRNVFPELAFEDLGERQVKNISRPVHVFRILLGLDKQTQDHNLFSYEKDVIKAYISGGGFFPRELVSRGCPRTWPEVRRVPTEVINPIQPQLGGAWRDAKIRVDARSFEGSDPSILDRMVFPEAGPRSQIISRDPLKVAVLVSGGIAPGINAALDGILSRHRQYAEQARRAGHGYHLELEGYQEGYKALTGSAAHTQLIDLTGCSGSATVGGTLLATARADELLDQSPVRSEKLREAARILNRDRIDILYVIGGAGSMSAASALADTYRNAYPEAKREPIIVGIPKTMDNDILWVWQSFGFLSAVERAREFIQHLYTEVTSNPRLAVVQLFGSDSGFVVSHAALGTGVCDIALIPEMDFDMDEVFGHLWSKLRERIRGSSVPHAIVLMAETALPREVEKYLDREKYKHVLLSENEEKELKKFLTNGRRVRGQTPDDLRSAALKIVSRDLQKRISDQGGYWCDFRVFVNEPRHTNSLYGAPHNGGNFCEATRNVGG